MADLMLEKSSSTKKDVAVGRSNHDEMKLVNCRRHPRQKQSPGICSICLTEKLSRLSATLISSSSSSSKGFTKRSYCSASSSSSYHSSASSCSSPMNINKFTNKDHKGKNKKKKKKHSLSILLFGGGGGGKDDQVLTKSRSLAFVPRMKFNKHGNETKKKQNGIFSKLLHPRSKKTDGDLVHSKSLREIIATTS